MKCLFIDHQNDCPAYPSGCGDCADAHSCREHMDDNGICLWCGAVVWGTSVWCDLYYGFVADSDYDDYVNSRYP